MEIAGFTLQPSEFMKPALIVLGAWMFSEGQKGEGVPGVLDRLLPLPALGGPAADRARRRPGRADHRRVRGGVLDGRRADELGDGRAARRWSAAAAAPISSSSTWRAASTASSGHDKTLDTHQVDRAAQAVRRTAASSARGRARAS